MFTEDQQIWLFGASFGLGALAIALIGKHILFCNKAQNENAAAFARIESALAQIKSELGTHETGIRGQLHSQSSNLLRLDGRVTSLERR